MSCSVRFPSDKSGCNTNPDSTLLPAVTSNFPALTTKYITRPDNLRSTTMIHKLVDLLKRAIKKAKTAVTTSLARVTRVFAPCASAITSVLAVIAVQVSSIVYTGKRHHLHRSHAPVYSLYTFFP